ncbi:PLP-dependent aminotransferase family protein [Massiliimalia timonensis]|uniref:aminotransferase n=1 Tax=Massiliimalia timonensis TaxID=1987501 RepID=UPI000B8A6A8F|nr:aminotransferase [Massiliimalia timonensis]MBS7174977.1 aminotransferase [Clostridiales bacterium]
MIPYQKMTKEELLKEQAVLQSAYKEFQGRGLKLDMSRGKPAPNQLDLSMGMLDVLTSQDVLACEDGLDARNYGLLDGIPEAKELYAEILEVSPDEVIIGGNSSLNMMYDTIVRAMQFGFVDSPRPWKDEKTVKCLCPVPGYDRHFAISELFGIEMINVPMTPAGPDMDLVEKLAAEDESIKFIWCVPMYSNPQGITYSDETVARFASMKTAAPDFKIIWDNAYCVHHLTDTPDRLMNLMDACKKQGTEDRVFIFASMSKISFPGAGIAAMAATKHNLDFVKQQMSIQTIGFDKIKQLRHVKYFKNIDGVKAHMQKHREILEPKFNAVLKKLDEEIKPLEIAEWHAPNGGYFISLDTMDGCAKRVVGLCKEAGAVMTGAGATYPYGKDPRDRNIRIAPTYPSVSELDQAMELFCLCVRLASVEKLLSEMN